MKLIWEEEHAACSNRWPEERKRNTGWFRTPRKGAANINEKAGTFGRSAVQKKPKRDVQSAQKHTLVSRRQTNNCQNQITEEPTCLGGF